MSAAAPGRGSAPAEQRVPPLRALLRAVVADRVAALAPGAARREGSRGLLWLGSPAAQDALAAAPAPDEATRDAWRTSLARRLELDFQRPFRVETEAAVAWPASMPRHDVVVVLGAAGGTLDLEGHCWNLHLATAPEGLLIHAGVVGGAEGDVAELTEAALLAFASRNGWTAVARHREWADGWSRLRAYVTGVEAPLARVVVLRKERDATFVPPLPPLQGADGFTDAARRIHAGVNRSGSLLYGALANWRAYEEALRVAEIPLEGARVLEVGAASMPMIPLLALLRGARRVAVNNVVPLTREIPAEAAEALAILTGAFRDVPRGRLESLVERRDDPRGATALLRPEVFSVHAPMGAESLPDEAGPADLVLSMAVLEHVQDVPAVARRTFQLTAPGGHGIHFIDLRDHRDFSRPIDFLDLTHEEYGRATGHSENRLRHQEQEAIFRGAGFQVVASLLMDRPMPTTGEGGTDVAPLLADGGFLPFYPARSVDEVRPWVTEAARAGMAEPFRGMSASSLSVLSQCLVVRRPPAAPR